MKKLTIAIPTILLLLALAAVQSATKAAPSETETIDIQVSPSTIQKSWNARAEELRVTVHADVSFSLFDTDDIEVWLDDVKATYIKSDARGDLVAKFDFDAVAAQVEPGTATLSLRAISRTGTVYAGTDEVRVVD
jgi:hypothetical protein